MIQIVLLVLGDIRFVKSQLVVLLLFRETDLSIHDSRQFRQLFFEGYISPSFLYIYLYIN